MRTLRMAGRLSFAGMGLMSAVLIVAGGCGSAEGAKSAGTAAVGAKGAKKGPIERKPFRVKTVRIETQSLNYVIRAVGNVEATDVFRIDARVAGTMYDVNFDVGDKVTKDQVICTIAPEAYRFKAQKQEALYKEAVAQLADLRRKVANEIERKRIDLDRAALEVARRKAIKEAGAISDEEVQLYQSRRDLAALELKDAREAAETEVKALESTILEREADWRIAEDDVRKSVVQPPIGGVIESRAVTNGMFVQAGTQLATIVDRSELKLRFKVSESETSALRVGEKVFFTVPAYPERKFEAQMYYIGAQLEQDTRVVMVHANVTKDADMLLPGYFAAVTLNTSRNVKAIVAPLLAIQPTERGFVAFVAKNGRAEQRIVKTGISATEHDVEIISGLSEGEILIVDGANALQDGVPLKIIDGPGADAAESAGDLTATNGVKKDPETPSPPAKKSE
jgi:membrane fusion protein, multidrug efflux system